MTKLPKGCNYYWHHLLTEIGLTCISRGKVRDTYRLNDQELLVIASDRISIFDFVLKNSIPKKGEVLTALTHFWLTKVLSEFQHHLVAGNTALNLKQKHGFLPLERCLVVKDFSNCLFPFEMIYRHHIGGSVYASYEETGIAAGLHLPKNLPKWSKLAEPIFTPSTKEEVGHDINVDGAYFLAEMGKKHLGYEAQKAIDELRRAYQIAYAYAEKKGILILDTKFEVASLPAFSPQPFIVDEILTPDSSRFALKVDWAKAMREKRDPSFLDKEPVRDWGRKIETPFKDENGNKIIGINKLKPENDEHVKFVHSLEIPLEIVSETANRYLKIFKLVTGYYLADYQKKRIRG